MILTVKKADFLDLNFKSVRNH